MDTRLFPRLEFDFDSVEVNGIALIDKLDESHGQSLGAGLARFSGGSLEWTLSFDEIVVGIEGVCTIEVEGIAHHIGPGDQLWLPKGVVATYTGENALISAVVSLPMPGTD